jgi:hypothetical protein
VQQSSVHDCGGLPGRFGMLTCGQVCIGVRSHQWAFEWSHSRPLLALTVSPCPNRASVSGTLEVPKLATAKHVALLRGQWCLTRAALSACVWGLDRVGMELWGGGGTPA